MSISICCRFKLRFVIVAAAAALSIAGFAKLGDLPANPFHKLSQSDVEIQH